MEASLIEDISMLRKQTFSDLEAIKGAVLRLSHQCWAGEQQYITRSGLLNEIEQDTRIPIADKEKVEAILAGR